MAAYYASVKASVRAEAQDAVYRRLQAAAFLTPEEMELLRWGRNATGERAFVESGCCGRAGWVGDGRQASLLACWSQ